MAFIQNSRRESGVGRRAQAIAERLRAADGVVVSDYMLDGAAGELRRDGRMQAQVRTWPGILGSKSVGWVRLGKKVPPGADVYDLTNQTLSFLAHRLQPAVVTVHDVIELIEPQARGTRWLNRYLYSGIPRAAHIIVVSRYTAQQVQEYYDVPAARVSVIYNGVDDSFHPIAAFRETVAGRQLRQRFKLTESSRVVLSVGSDHPRKNLPGALQAFARARQIGGQAQGGYPELVFLKVGAAGVPAGREATLAAVDSLQIRDAVRFIERVSREELNELYNLADVLLFPSRLEGFGLPALEAFTAGTPVVCSDAASLPEVAGNDGSFGERAALMHDPDDIEGLAADIVRVVEDQELASQLRAKGFTRATQFSWNAAAEQVLAVYKQVSGA